MRCVCVRVWLHACLCVWLRACGVSPPDAPPPFTQPAVPPPPHTLLHATQAGFRGGLVVDFPHSTRAKKYFLVLMVGGSAVLPAAKGEQGVAVWEGIACERRVR